MSWQHEDVCLVRVKGELDLADSDALTERLGGLSDRTVVVDLSELAFIDSSGLRAFVAAKLKAADAGHELLLTRPQPNVERLFAVTGLDGLIDQWRPEWSRCA